MGASSCRRFAGRPGDGRRYPRVMRRLLLFVVLALGSPLVAVHAASAQTTRMVTVTPDSGLLSGDVVTIEGSGYTPAASVAFCQAVAVDPASPSNCGVPYCVVNDGQRRPLLRDVHRRALRGPASARNDRRLCGCCATLRDRRRRAQRPRRYGDRRPARVRARLPYLTVSPGSGASTGTSVAVDGTELPPDVAVTVRQCVPAIADDMWCVGGDDSDNAAGSFTTSLVVQSWIGSHQCFTTPPVGSLRRSRRGDGVDDDQDCVRRTWRMEPSSGLRSGQTVTVSGREFRAGQLGRPRPLCRGKQRHRVH